MNERPIPDDLPISRVPVPLGRRPGAQDLAHQLTVERRRRGELEREVGRLRRRMAEHATELAEVELAAARDVARERALVGELTRMVTQMRAGGQRIATIGDDALELVGEVDPLAID